ncbi:hypothetical protein PM082_004616 [Marasmius tenuissimus]|nr:hypothetical protein PM082_004616 [Marasmius tenuissimus]
MASATGNPSSSSQKDAEKASVEEIDFRDDHSVNDEDRPSGRFGYFLKKNPSPRFLADVVKMNQTELDPKEVKRIERKVDLLIIPALAVCYMSWLSSLFYFGWVAWAFPTNLLMQKFPVNKYLAVNARIIYARTPLQALRNVS